MCPEAADLHCQELHPAEGSWPAAHLPMHRCSRLSQAACADLLLSSAGPGANMSTLWPSQAGVHLSAGHRALTGRQALLQLEFSLQHKKTQPSQSCRTSKGLYETFNGEAIPFWSAKGLLPTVSLEFSMMFKRSRQCGVWVRRANGEDGRNTRQV